MAEYGENTIQRVEDEQNVLLNTVISCNKGYVLHRNGSGIITLRGIVNNPCASVARYKLLFNSNIAIPEDGTLGEISVAISLNGEPMQLSRARSTPAAINQYNNVSCPAIIDVARGCCVTVAVENVSGQAINAQNSILDVARIA